MGTGNHVIPAALTSFARRKYPIGIAIRGLGHKRDELVNRDATIALNRYLLVAESETDPVFAPGAGNPGIF